MAVPTGLHTTTPAGSGTLGLRSTCSSVETCPIELSSYRAIKTFTADRRVKLNPFLKPHSTAEESRGSPRRERKNLPIIWADIFSYFLFLNLDFGVFLFFFVLISYSSCCIQHGRERARPLSEETCSSSVPY